MGWFVFSRHPSSRMVIAFGKFIYIIYRCMRNAGSDPVLASRYHLAVYTAR
jgi:hypothetical protein